MASSQRLVHAGALEDASNLWWAIRPAGAGWLDALRGVVDWLLAAAVAASESA